MTSREEPCRNVFLPTFPMLSWVMLFALVCGVVAADVGLTQSVYAEETETTDEEAQDSEKPKAEEKDNDTDQDAAEKVDTEKDSEDPKQADEESEEKPEKKSGGKSEKKKEAPPADNAGADEPVSKEEQEKAEKAADDNVSEAEEAADKKEDAEAAAEEATGKTEVEIDESGDEEEEPADSAESDKKPPVVENEKQPDKGTPEVQKRVIGATATIMEKQSELLFRARVDSGAKSCSLHIEDYKIENEEELMADNIGKVVRFHIKNGNDESHWLEAKIAGYVIVKTAAHRERRYKVPLTLRFKDFEKTVLVTLNNREKMEFPLLLGRNFLMGDFVVDVEVENSELHTR